jgi:hypothetical protein
MRGGCRATLRDRHAAWFHFVGAYSACADDHRSRAHAARERCGGGRRIRFRRVGYRIRRARYGDLVLEIDRGVRGAVFRDELDARLHGDAFARRSDLGARACSASGGRSARSGASRGDGTCRIGGACFDSTGAAGFSACDVDAAREQRSGTGGYAACGASAADEQALGIELHLSCKSCKPTWRNW